VGKSLGGGGVGGGSDAASFVRGTVLQLDGGETTQLY